MSSHAPRVESFVLRFVSDTPEAGVVETARHWHGTVVHVQTNEEKSFTAFADAVAFIERYVPVGSFDFDDQDDDSESE